MNIIVALFATIITLGVGYLGLRYHKNKWQESEQESKSMLVCILIYIGYSFIGAILAFMILIGMMMLMLFLS